MDLSESDSTVDYKNALPSLVLPNPDSKKKITTKISKKAMLKEIKSLLKDMKKNDRRTTNFAIMMTLIKSVAIKLTLLLYCT